MRAGGGVAAEQMKATIPSVKKKMGCPRGSLFLSALSALIFPPARRARRARARGRRGADDERGRVERGGRYTVLPKGEMGEATKKISHITMMLVRR